MNDVAIGRLVRQTALLIGVWTVPVIIGTAGHYFGMMVEGGGMPPSHIFGHSFAMWYVWIVATPVVFWIYRRLPINGPAWPAALLAHAGTLTLLFVAQAWCTLVLGQMSGHIPSTQTFSDQLTQLVVNLLLYDVFIYSAVLAVAFGLDYAKRFRDRDLRASQLETQLERARLEALQMQLQPHFLFNSLNSIAMLVRRERKQEALDVVVGFSELLRYVLDEAGTMDVALEEELTFVRRYLEIEKVRHRERLAVEFAVEMGTEKALVPNLILQPLVENALKHGVSTNPAGGRVRISAARRGETLRLEVENDGASLPAGFTLETSSGLGLRNLRERLGAFFGAAGHLTVRASDRGGVIAVVEIPFSTEPTRTAAVERAG